MKKNINGALVSFSIVTIFLTGIFVGILYEKHIEKENIKSIENQYSIILRTIQSDIVQNRNHPIGWSIYRDRSKQTILCRVRYDFQKNKKLAAQAWILSGSRLDEIENFKFADDSYEFIQRGGELYYMEWHIDVIGVPEYALNYKESNK